MSYAMQTQVKAPPAIKPVALTTQSGLLQRQCACGGSPGVDGECAECRAKRLSMQRQAATPAASSQAVPPIVHEVLSSPGHSLDAGTRAFMEPRFGHDFSTVRVHTDAKAAESARVVNALAYTVGRNVVFGTGQYSPGTSEGKRLMAHELTHVVQQRGGQLQTKLRFSQSSDPHEREADMIAQSIISETTGQRLTWQATPSISQIQRQAIFDDTEEGDDGATHDGDSPVSGTDSSQLAQNEQSMTGGLMVSQVFTTEVEGEHVDTPTRPDAGTIPDAGTPTPAQDKGPAKTKPFIAKIDVFLKSPQHLVLHWSDGRPPEEHSISSGKGDCGTVDKKGNHIDPCPTGNEKHCTPTGTWTIDLQLGPDAKNRNGAPIAWFAGLNISNRHGIGIHNSQEVNGEPLSHGCVRVGKGKSAKDEGWSFARKINRNVIKGLTTVTISGKANTHWYPCPPPKKVQPPKKVHH